MPIITITVIGLILWLVLRERKSRKAYAGHSKRRGQPETGRKGQNNENF